MVNREIADEMEKSIARMSPSHEDDDALRGIMNVDPFEAAWIAVPLPESGMLVIDTVKRLDILMHAAHACDSPAAANREIHRISTRRIAPIRRP